MLCEIGSLGCAPHTLLEALSVAAAILKDGGAQRATWRAAARSRSFEYSVEAAGAQRWILRLPEGPSGDSARRTSFSSLGLLRLPLRKPPRPSQRRLRAPQPFREARGSAPASQGDAGDMMSRGVMLRCPVMWCDVDICDAAMSSHVERCRHVMWFCL